MHLWDEIKNLFSYSQVKILHVIASMDPRTGGTCQAVRSLFSQAVEKVNTMEVVCLDDPNSDYLAKESLPIRALGRGRGPWSYHPALRPWLEKNLPRFDVVILNGLWLYPGYVMSSLARCPKAPPYFVFPHGMLDPWFQRAPGRRLKTIRNWFYWKLIEHRVISRAGAVFFTCAEELRLARETFRPYQPRQEINVGYGIAPPPDHHQAMEAAFVEKCSGLNGRPFFLFLGRIHPKKGVDLLIKAYAAIYGGRTAAAGSPSRNTQRPRLVIAGPGRETGYGKEMEELAARICPLDSVFWPGMLTGDAKWGALYHAEAFVLTSHQENFGIAVVEALACGTPVLISNQINIWREIAEDQAGLADDDTLEGAEQLFRRWEKFSPGEKAAMKLAAKSSYEYRFDIGLAAQNLLDTIKELTRRPHGAELVPKNG